MKNRKKERTNTVCFEQTSNNVVTNYKSMNLINKKSNLEHLN